MPSQLTPWHSLAVAAYHFDLPRGSTSQATRKCCQSIQPACIYTFSYKVLALSSSAFDSTQLIALVTSARVFYFYFLWGSGKIASNKSHFITSSAAFYPFPATKTGEALSSKCWWPGSIDGGQSAKVFARRSNDVICQITTCKTVGFIKKYVAIVYFFVF